MVPSLVSCLLHTYALLPHSLFCLLLTVSGSLVFFCFDNSFVPATQTHEMVSHHQRHGSQTPCPKTTRPKTTRPTTTRPRTARPMTTRPMTSRPMDNTPHGQLAPRIIRHTDISPHGHFAPRTTRHMDNSPHRHFAPRTSRPMDNSPQYVCTVSTVYKVQHRKKLQNT
jgi:hypothetical protein